MLTLVYGYGTSGKSAINCLKKLGRQVAVYCDKQVDNVKDIIDLSGKPFDEVLKDVGLIVVSPSVDLNSKLLIEAKRRNIEIIGELELGYRNALGDIIAITGTNGKTTCTRLITKILKNSGINSDYYGNIGVPLAENSFDITEDKVGVVEVSSFQLATTELFCPKIAICLNIAEDHLEYHKTMNDYINCKRNLFKNQDKNEYAILNYDDEIVNGFSNKINSDTYYFSLHHKVKGGYLKGHNIYFCGDKPEFICNLNDIKMQGEHNIANCLACITACKILNIPNSIIVNTLKEFEVSAHRMQLLDSINGVKYYNDSKSTNIHSTLSACRAVKGKTTLLIGGYDKGLDYTKLFNELPIKVNTVICFGDNKDKIIKDSKKSYSTTIIRADSLEDAIDIASKVKCENVLFSPSTSSYDRFSDYVERGNFFKEYIRGLKIDKV